MAGFDLRNEVRPSHGVLAEWGTGDENDFALAQEKVGNMILEVFQSYFYTSYYF